MSKQLSETGVYQLDNGYWAYRFIIKVNGENKIQRRSKGLDGQPFKTQKQAARARSKAIEQEQINALLPPKKEIVRKTVQEVFREYCEYGRNGKAYVYRNSYNECVRVVKIFSYSSSFSEAVYKNSCEIVWNFQ